MVGIAQRGDADGPVFQILQSADLFRHFRRAGESEQRQSSGGREAGDLRAVGEGLKRHVEGRARVVHRTADQRLHRDVAAARVNQADVEAFVGEMAARARHLVRDDAEQLAAEREQHLAALAVGIFLGDEQDAARQDRPVASEPSSTDDFFIARYFRVRQ